MFVCRRFLSSFTLISSELRRWRYAMDEKKCFIKLIKYMLGIMIAGIFFVWLIDPFYHYHTPIGKVPIVLDTAVYQTAGAAKNLEYDSAIVGTSMTENFHTSWFDEVLGWNTMKLSYSGARSSDLEAIFGEISERKEPIKNILSTRYPR